jgi:hypothetical protein
MNLIKGGALVAAAALAATPAYAQQSRTTDPAPVGDLGGFSLSATTGIDYSVGNYGLAEKTKILVVPFSLRAQTGQLALTATLPYLRIDSPGGVVVGPGGEPLPGVPSAGGVRDGLGDLSLGATYTIPLGGPEFALGGRVKLPTSSKDRQLGTGETDYSFSGEFSYPLGGVVPFVNLGYRFLGDPPGLDLRNGPTASVGTSIQMGSSALIVSYDYARAIVSTIEDSHELFGGVTVPVGSRLNVTGYGVAGLSQGSPDFGVGLMLTTKLF